MPRSVPNPAVASQLLIVALAFAVLAVWPPRQGRLLLISAAGDPVETINAAVSGDAALLGPGPFPGSMVVIGDRARIAARIGRRAMLLTAAPPAGCQDLSNVGNPV